MQSQADIILVEDDPDDVYLFLNACEQLSPRPKVEVLYSGSELLEHVKHSDCSEKLILIDLNMPQMSGLETMQRLNDAQQEHPLCFIGFTTSSNAKDVKRAYQLGAKSFISKPATLTEMIELVNILSLYWFKFNRFYKEVQ